MRRNSAGAAARLPQRWVAALGETEPRNPKPIKAPLTRPRMAIFHSLLDGTVSGAGGFLTHRIAPLADFCTAEVAHLGVMPEWQNACSSTPLTQRRRGWWFSA